VAFNSNSLCLCASRSFRDVGSEQKAYDEVKDPEKAVAIMNELLNEFNDENSPMKLVLFKVRLRALPEALGR
jgi:hypothetical protein